MSSNLELLNLCKEKTDRMLSKLDVENGLRETFMEDNGSYTYKMVPMENNVWTQSFFTGIVAYMYYHYREQKYLDFLYGLFGYYEKNLYSHLEEIDHDAGFIHSLYAVAAYKITGDVKFQRMALKAADELDKRHHYESGVIASFCSLKDSKINMIADDVMNLQLIIWAHSETNHPFYERVYKKHAQAVINYIIREDYTVRHAYGFDAKTGEPLTEKNWCGYSCGSAWARGTAWTLYGMNSMIKHTSDKYLYLPSLEGVANVFIRNIEKTDMIPVWDFRLPERASHMKDSSAAIIAASAFWSAERDIPKDDRNGELKRCGEVSDAIFEKLVENYLAPAEHDNILTKAQCGNKNVGSIWGDYFFVELLMKRIYGDKAPNFWI